jgi:ribonuclease HI
MVRPSRIARKARRAHERQQGHLWKQNLPICQGCDLCSATKSREVQKAIRDSNIPYGQRQEHKQSRRSRVRQSLKNKVFEGAVVIRSKIDALAEGADEVGFCAEPGRLVYWTDGSRLKNSCGVGISYCSSTETWIELSWRVRKTTKTHILEIYAIAKALEIALVHYRNVEAKRRSSKVYIYSDCLGALEYFARSQQTLTELQKLPYGEELVGPGIIAANYLCAFKVEVELRCVPGHAGIQGNLKADRAARKGAKRPIGKREVGKPMAACASLGHHDIRESDKSLHEDTFIDVMTLF